MGDWESDIKIGETGKGSEPVEIYDEERVKEEEAIGNNIAVLKIFEKFDPDIRMKVEALRKLQVDYLIREAKFYEEACNLQIKYASVYEELYKERFRIVKGETTETGKSKQENGIPDFWLGAFLNSNVLYQLIDDDDEAVLKHLKDVRLKYEQENPLKFRLEFHFEPNKYFYNSILTKDYEMECKVDCKEPCSFAGPEIVRCKGCKIDWKEGMNILLTTIKKRVTNEFKSIPFYITKLIRKESFFNFFNPPLSATPETNEQLLKDFEIGQYFKEKLIPNAILYYTGEVEDSSDEDEDENDDSSEESHDENYRNHQPRSRNRKN
ncbi:nucleosome assembly protein 1-like 1 [Centruroides vittatus]|uniref:nucleosome assembly protein 1-like 1 n=1 Tax=Centruroides vittatus TaxID=120091 RepID=UPI0035100302